MIAWSPNYHDDMTDQWPVYVAAQAIENPHHYLAKRKDCV